MPSCVSSTLYFVLALPLTYSLTHHSPHGLDSSDSAIHFRCDCTRCSATVQRPCRRPPRAPTSSSSWPTLSNTEHHPNRTTSANHAEIRLILRIIATRCQLQSPANSRRSKVINYILLQSGVRVSGKSCGQCSREIAQLPDASDRVNTWEKTPRRWFRIGRW